MNKMKEENVIVDESLVLKFEDSTDSTQPPAKRIKQEPTDPEESKVFVDSTTQTEVFEVEKETQTDRPIVYVCKLCRSNKRHRSSESLVSVKIHFYFEKKLVMIFFIFSADILCLIMASCKNQSVGKMIFSKIC